MTERSIPLFNDPMMAPFWEAAWRREFLLQRCRGCGSYQFYPRPFCLRCLGDQVEWAPASGLGTVFSQTTVHVKVIPELEPPYVVALVHLDEGPLFTTNLVGGSCAIGDRVRLAWRERENLPPLPVFTPIERSSDAAS